jgi:hypothetical protein
VPFAVFAVFAGNYQRTRLRVRQKTWAAEGSAAEITAGRPPLYF